MTRRSQHHRRRRSKAAANAIQQLPFAQYQVPFSALGVVSDDELDAIHHASLDVLERFGIKFLLPEAVALLKDAGGEVLEDGQRVRLPRELVLNAIASAPSEFTLHARNPSHNLRFGANYINFSAVSSPPNVSDIDNGRRSGNFDDYCQLLKLTQMINMAQLTMGHPVEPIDIDTSVRHLDSTLARIELTDKIFGLYSLSTEGVRDVLDMVKILFQVDDDGLTQAPRVFTNINCNSPLLYDGPMLSGIIEMARRGQVVNITPFTLAGAMAPITLAGAAVQQNAEALAGISVSQLANPGAPVMYGGFTSNVDMKTGSPAFGTPEYAKAVLLGGQLARRYGIPYRSSNVNASNAPDAQAVYESEMSLWAVMMAHCNLVHHGLGWLEGGLCASYEKFILDAEMIQGLVSFMTPVEVNPATLAVDSIGEVGPGGHHFGTQHTLERYEGAFYAPMVSDWRNFETWSESGAHDATQRANAIYKSLLDQYQAPPLDAAINEALREFVAKRKRERRTSNN